MHASLTVERAGETVELLADRALFWPSERLLLIADLHLGKGEALRRGGIAVPRGGTRSDLNRLHALLARTGATELCVLGDFLHGPAQGTWREDWQAWRMQHADLPISVVAGNHDRQLARHAAAWQLTLLEEGVQRAPFHLRHAPGAGAHVIAGHVHPRVRYPGLPGRWPAFLLRPQQTVLPAFSLFTGGACTPPEENEQAVACLDGLVAVVPPGGRSP